MSDFFIVAAEPSGDELGGSLMAALSRMDASASFRGVGGTAMAAQGLQSLFPMTELAVFGFGDAIAKLSRLRLRLRETADAILSQPPDALILIDSWGFSFRVARRVRRKLPGLPIIKYVSPQVWASRPGRAKAMRPYFDLTLALFPFEPEAHRKLGGPPCSYVGHPLIERLPLLRPSAEEAMRRNAKPPVLLVLPGSRRSEISHLAPIFGEAVATLHEREGPFDVVLPTLPHIRSLVEAEISGWPVKPRIVASVEEKFAAMRTARAAITASGTATLELALSGVPHVGAYRMKPWEAFIVRRLVTVSMALLPNLLLGKRVVPEFIQSDCTPENIVRAIAPLIADGAERNGQLKAFAKLDEILGVAGAPPSARAAAAVLDALASKSRNGA